MIETYIATYLPISVNDINQIDFINELIDAASAIAVYKEKVKDSKLDSSWFMPTLQQKEALASSQLEGTQATIDGVFINEVSQNCKDKNLNEVNNYYHATAHGFRYLNRHSFSNDFFYDIHSDLMSGNVRKPKQIGVYRTEQNYIGRTDNSHSITFIPPASDSVPLLMDNLIEYMNNPTDNIHPLIRAAIIHAQFETIHPFMDGNGRMGRILIPMYLFSQKLIDMPYFFISEVLERDKIRYYSLLNDIRFNNNWSDWIKFFLSVVTMQCKKYINVIGQINELYESHLEIACNIAKGSNMVKIVNALFRYPITNSKQLSNITKLPIQTVNRYLSTLVKLRIIYTDDKIRNKYYYYYELLDIIRL